MGKGRSVRISVPRRLNLYVASLVLATALAVVSPLLASESVNFPSALRQAGAAVQLSGYLYRPDGPGPFPAVVMLHGCSCGATVGTEPVARADAIRAVTQFFASELGGRGVSP